MFRMKPRTFLVFVCYIFQWSYLQVSSQIEYLCNDEIIEYEARNQITNRCNYVSSKSVTWRQAWDKCHKDRGWMVNCPSCSTGTGAILGNQLLAKNGVSSIWTGQHVTSELRLLNDAFPTPDGIGTLRPGWNNTGALESRNLCVIEEFQGCQRSLPAIPEGDIDAPGPMTKKKRRRRRWARLWRKRTKRAAVLPDTLPDGCVPDYRQRLVSCDEEHTFACYYSGVDAKTMMSGEGENLSLYGSLNYHRKFYLAETRSFLNSSDEECSKTNSRGQAFRSHSPNSDKVLLTALVLIITGQLEERDLSTAHLETTLYWYHDYQNRCRAVLLSSSNAGDNPPNHVTTDWPCTAKLPVLCELPPVEPETLAPVVTPFFNGENTEGYSFDGKTVSLRSNLVGRGLLKIECVVPTGFREFQSVTLYRNGVPLQRNLYNIELKSVEFLPPEAELAIEFMNSYHCEVNDPITNKLIKSNTISVFISDFIVYSLHVGLKEPMLPATFWDGVIERSLGDNLNDYVINPRLGVVGENFNVIANLVETQQQKDDDTAWNIRPVEFIKEPSSSLVFLAHRLDTNFIEGSGPTEFLSQSDQIEVYRNQIVKMFKQESEILPEVNLDAIILYSILLCLPKNITVEGINDYQLPETSGGETWESPQTCARDGKPLVTVLCQGSMRLGYQWDPVRVNPLCGYYENNASDSILTDDLKTVSQENVTKDNVEDILERTKDITDGMWTGDIIQPIDVALIADILQKSSEVDDLTTDQAIDILNTATRITSLGEGVLVEAQKIGNAASRLIKSMDDLGQIVQVSDQTNMNRLVSDKLAVEVWDLTGKSDRDIVTGLKVLTDDNDELIKTNDLVSLYTAEALQYSQADVAILLPKEFILKLTGGSLNVSVRLAMNVYADTSLYQAANNNSDRDASLNSKVIAAKILVNNIPISDISPYNVTTVFLPKVRVSDDERSVLSVCAFWDFGANYGVGDWNTEGCRYSQTRSGRDVCTCDHLTNFAVLVNFHERGSLDSDIHDEVLGVVTMVGLILSIIGLSITALSFLCIKKLKQGRPQQTLFNLSIALLLTWVVFLAGITRTENRAGCITVAALLHYLVMASFMWMLMEGILQYLLFVKVMNTYFTNYMVKTAIPAWGLPIIPVMIVLAIDPELYRGRDKYCWMSADVAIYAFAIPVGLIILTNLIIFIMVVVSLCKRRDVRKHSTQGSNQTVINIRASFICFFILGLTWVFGFLTIGSASIVFQYIFCISASLQGFVIFLMMTARDKMIRAYWKSVFCDCFAEKRKQKAYRTWGDKGTSATSGSTPGTQNTGTTSLSGTEGLTSLSTDKKSGETDLSDVTFNLS